MFAHLLYGRSGLRALLRISTIVAGLGLAAAAHALPSCPTLSYEGVTPAAGSLVDPTRPTITFRFSRNIMPISIQGGSIYPYPGPYPWSKPTTKSFARIAILYDDYGISQPIDINVNGSNVSITPQIALKPNKSYRFLLQGIAGPILAEFPDSLSAALCSRPSINYNIVAEYFTRPTVTGGCLTGPTAIATNRYGLTPGCKYNLTYDSWAVSNEDDDITDVVWAWGNARFLVRGYTSYPTSEQRGVKVEMKNITWNGAYWVAQSAVARVTGSANTPQSVPEGSVIANLSNVIVGYGNNILLTEVYVQGSNGYQQNLVPAGDVRGTLMLGPGI